MLDSAHYSKPIQLSLVSGSLRPSIPCLAQICTLAKVEGISIPIGGELLFSLGLSGRLVDGEYKWRNGKLKQPSQKYRVAVTSSRRGVSSRELQPLLARGAAQRK